MNISQHFSARLIGFALFSMFFGSGNLMFPLSLGVSAQGDLFYGALGFILAAVLLPLFGVLVMVLYEGDADRFFSFLPSKAAFGFIALLLTIWIPLGSGPRCIALAYSSFGASISLPPLWLYSLIYSVAIFFAIRSPSRTLDILGYLLTPALLVSLGVLFGLAFWDAAPPSLSSTSANHLQTVILGVSEGYNTMDFIAAIFFSISVIGLLKNVGEGPKNPVKTTLFASLIAMALLVVVYSGLILVSAQHSELLQGLPREELLSVVSQHLMGGHIAALAGVIVGLACVSTSMALMVVYIEFLTKRCGLSQPLSAGLTFGVSWLMSITGVGGVTALTGPLLGICYPLLLGYAAVQMVRVGLKTCRMKKCQLKDKTAPLQSVD